MPSTSSAERVFLLGTVQGLVSEAARVREAFEAARPAAVALGVSPEGAAALSRYEPEPGANLFEDLPDHDFMYSVKLEEFGPVALPPPDLLEATRLAREAGVAVYGVDIPEEAYEERFLEEVSALALFRYGRIQRRLAKRPPSAPDARAFSLAWDAAIRKVKGIDRVEAARERRMAEGAWELAGRDGRVLLLVDAPREAGVRRRLDDLASEKPLP